VDSRGRSHWRRWLLVGILIGVMVGGFAIIRYRQKTVVIQLSLYSGNSWGVPQNFAYAIFDRVVEMFEADQNGSKHRVVLKTGTMYKDYSEWFAQLVLKGREPDVFLILEEDFNTYASIGLLENLDSYMMSSDTFSEDTFFPKALEAGRYQGNQYSLPISMVPSFLIYNASLFKELGLQLDLDNWTWEQFYEHCKALTADTDGDGTPDRFGVEGYDWHHAFYTNDDNLFNENGDKAGFNDERMLEMIDFLKNLHVLNKGTIIKDGDFERGDVGFKTFNFSEFRVYGSYPYRLLRYDDFEWDAIPFPRGPNGNSASKLYTVQIGMSSRSKQKDVAFDFLEFISSNEAFQYEIWRYTNTLPVNRNVFDRIYYEELQDNGEMKALDKDFLEYILACSYIDPDFKKYSLIDNGITQRIFKIVAQNENPRVGTQEIRQLIDQYLATDAGVKPIR
jgi:multiple sugar transport system substrate-binding protein